MQVEILENAGTFGSVAVIILMVFLTVIAGFKICSQPPYNARLLTPMLLSVATNVAILVYRILFGKYLALDENVWHRQALTVGEAIRGNAQLTEGALTSGKEGYAWLVGLLYAFAGPAPLVAIVLNILLYSLLIPILSIITALVAAEMKLSENTSKRAVIFTAYFIALNPVIAFWSPRMLREIISMFLIAMSVMCLLLLLKKKNAVYLIGLIVLVAMMVGVREQIGAGLGASLLMGMVVVQSLKIRGHLTRIAFMAPIFAGLFFATWRFVDLSVEDAARNNTALSQATSAFAGAETIQSADSIMDIILFNLPRVLFGPFIHEMNFSYVMILAAVSNIFWLGAAALALWGFLGKNKMHPGASERAKNSDKSSWAILVLVVVLLTFSVMLSITAGNYGLVIRMRLMPFTVLAPLAGLGYAFIFERREVPAARESSKNSIPSQ